MSFREQWLKPMRRENTHSVKWDFMPKVTKNKNSPIPLWVADMDLPSPPMVKDAARERLDHSVYGYTYFHSDYFQPLKSWLIRNHQWNTIDISHFAYSPSVITTLYNIISLFTKVDDKVLITPPVYQPFFTVVQKQKRELVCSPLMYEKGSKYFFDFELFEQTLHQNKPKIFILCNPHNPVGRVWSYEELKKIAQLCSRYGVSIISDEIHSDLIFSEHKHTPLGCLAEYLTEPWFACYSPSKTFNLAGMLTSAVYFSDKKQKKVFNESLASQGLVLPNVLGAKVFYEIYKSGQDWKDDLCLFLEENFQLLFEVFEKVEGITCTPSQGTYLAWLDCNEFEVSQGTVYNYFLNELGLALEPGAKYGKEAKNFLRLNFATDRETLLKVKNILEDSLL